MITLFLLAAMQGVSRDLYEAAWVDGAGRWYRFRRITIPQIMPVLVSMALLSAIWTFNSFEIIWILTEGGPRSATTTLIVDTYKNRHRQFQIRRRRGTRCDHRDPARHLLADLPLLPEQSEQEIRSSLR